MRIFTFNKTILLLALGNGLISFGGLLLHLRIHPPALSLFNWWATGFAALNALLVPLLFLHARSLGLAYLLNTATVVAGLVGMSYYSLTHAPEQVSASWIFLGSTFPDIVILLSKLCFAHAILLEWRRIDPPHETRGCRP